MAGPSIALIHDSATGEIRTLTTEDLAGASGSPGDPSIVQGTDGVTAERLATRADQVTANGHLSTIATARTPYNSIGVAASGTAKNSAGTLRSVTAHNRSGSTLYLWLTNEAAFVGNVADLLWQPILLEAGTQVLIGADLWGSAGLAASTGISWAFSTGATSHVLHGTAAECSLSAVVL